jgi:4-aminobutyrate aminotransferase
MLTNQTLAQRRRAAVAQGLVNMSDIYIARAHNSTVYDVEGREYIDFASGTGTMNVGHGHPRVLQAIKQQAELFTHTFFQQLPYENYVVLAEQLNAKISSTGENKTAFFVDGAGAVENAVKIARAYTNRSAVISFQNSYHGRTSLTTALCGRARPYKDQIGPKSADIYHAAWNDINSILDLFKYTVAPDQVSAVIFEPVQGEGGIVPADPTWLNELRKICDQHGIVLIADEIQTGFARTGRMWGMDHYDVNADITVLSKSLGAGLPISAVVGRSDIIDSYQSLGGTFGGNPMACAAGLAVLEIIDDENLVERSRLRGLELRDRLRELQQQHPAIADIRGLGSMTGIDIVDAEGQADQALTKKIQARARALGLILISAGLQGNTLRFLYPLTITDAEFNSGLNILTQTFKELC